MRELNLLIANEFRNLESESEATTIKFLKGNVGMSETLVVEMNVKFLAEGIDAVELWTYWNDFLKERTELVSRTGRRTPIEVVESHFTSIVAYDSDENERRYLDGRGNLDLTSEEIEVAIQKGLIGEAI